MKGSQLLVLLSTALLLCSAAPALETVTCTQDGAAAAARQATRDINQNHRHGYKFRLNATKGSNLEKDGEGCNFQLELQLLETKCHVVNPKPFDDCPFRGEPQREVMANCNVTVTVKDGEANVTKYACDTRQVKTNIEMVRICPDCVTLLPLNNTEGLKSVHEAVRKFNTNTTNQHYYILKEVGRISAGYMMTTGMNYYAEFALVETHCPMGSRILPEACVPLCPDRARHAFCRSSYSKNNMRSTECEFYPPLNTTELAPGEQEPMCRHHHHHHHHHHHGPPPHAHDHGRGPPPHADKEHGRGPPPHSDEEHGRGRPSHGHGPPPHAHDHGHGPPPHADKEHGRGRPSHADKDHEHGPPSQGRDHEHGSTSGHKRHHKFFGPCHGSLTYIDPALHPICPWPFPEHHKRKPSQS